MTLRELAKGKPCLVAIPGICDRDTEKTVLAHIRRGSIAGSSQKPPDTCAVWACHACRDEIDRRTRHLEIEAVNDYILDALCRQLAWYDKNEILVAVI